MHSVVLLIWLTLCAAQDARQRHIGNGLTLGAGGLAAVYLLVTGNTWLGAEAAQAGWAVLLALALCLPGYILKRFGAGDVKLMTALALATNGTVVLGAFIGAALSSALWLLLAPKLWLHMRQGLRERLRYLQPDKSKKLPFAPFVLIGTILTLCWIH
ncbi:prepilin peptidase CpaA [Pseudomonas baetica]|uniref:Prepilin peptidase CpaA n=1 Tax=Pseudomonas baetica TaxID=674054 RepID=A0ABX4PX40_9PSED|nr:prepilin peptidase [Pseudomonas baetica]PKA69535.1 prepilin peptidase CpaA [Pseudomonas baetica]PTC20666.1 prepilin peptidase [Pseudomonas baetica]